MKTARCKHLIICLFLGLLAVPIYFLDRAFLGPQAGGGNWITLDFRGLIFWTYITLVAIQVTVSSIAILIFPKSGALRILLWLDGDFRDSPRYRRCRLWEAAPSGHLE